MKIVDKIIKKSETKILSAIIASTLLCIVSCSKQSQQVIDYSKDIPLTINEEFNVSTDSSKSEAKYWNQNVKDFIGQICIVFGYGFNDETYVKSTIEELEKTFGDTDQGKLFYTVVYPTDLKSRIMNLYDSINERDIKGLIILGAPQNTHFMVAKLQDYWGEQTPYPVFSFFPKDDILGQQGTCNFILETQQTTEDESPEATAELEAFIQKESIELLKNSVHFIVTLPEPLPLDSDLITHVEKIAGNKKIHRYQDPETGIKPQNHFILE